jgi:hypothetical protein
MTSQTGRTFKTRFKEYIRVIKINGQNSKFVQHILDTKHEFETIEKTIKRTKSRYTLKKDFTYMKSVSRIYN